MTTKTLTTTTTGKAKEIQELLVKLYDVKNTELAGKIITTSANLQTSLQKALNECMEEVKNTADTKAAQEYEAQYQAIITKYADKDENGEFIYKQLENGQLAYTFTAENAKLRNEEMEALGKANKEVLSKIQNLEQEIANKEFGFEAKLSTAYINEFIKTNKQLSVNDILVFETLKKYL